MSRFLDELRQQIERNNAFYERQIGIKSERESRNERAMNNNDLFGERHPSRQQLDDDKIDALAEEAEMRERRYA